MPGVATWVWERASKWLGPRRRFSAVPRASCARGIPLGAEREVGPNGRDAATAGYLLRVVAPCRLPLVC